MRFIFKIIFLSLFASSAYAGHKKGLIIYIDGLESSHKSDFAKLLLSGQYFNYFSAEDYAKKKNERFYKSAVLMLKAAVNHARMGDRIILDSIVVEKFFYLKKNPKFDVITVGVWCSLSCLKERYDKAAGRSGAYKQSRLESEYRGRYGDRDTNDIIESKGAYWYNDKFKMKYDLFLDSGTDSNEVMLEKFHSYLTKRYPGIKIPRRESVGVAK